MDEAVAALVDVRSGDVEDVEERMERDPTTKVVLSPREAAHPPNSSSSCTALRSTSPSAFARFSQTRRHIISLILLLISSSWNWGTYVRNGR